MITAKLHLEVNAVSQRSSLEYIRVATHSWQQCRCHMQWQLRDSDLLATETGNVMT